MAIKTGLLVCSKVNRVIVPTVTRPCSVILSKVDFLL